MVSTAEWSLTLALLHSSSLLFTQVPIRFHIVVASLPGTREKQTTADKQQLKVTQSITETKLSSKCSHRS